MRAYTIDQLQEADIAAITKLLGDMELQSSVEGIYWLPVPEKMLTSLQKEHEDHCGPYCLALEVESDAIHLELLVRGMGRIRCECVGFASVELRNHMIAYLEHMFTDLNILF